MRPECKKNEDMQLSDEEFIKITSPLGPAKFKRLFTAEEDSEIWKYVLGNQETFNKGNRFWKKLSQKLIRQSSVLSQRFNLNLAPKLHTMNFPVGVKLKLFKKCRITVDKECLEELKKHAYLIVDEERYITGYQLKDGRAEKRKSTEESDGSAKKARGSGSETADESDDGESTGNEDAKELIINGVVWGDVPKKEPIDEYTFSEQLLVTPRIEEIKDDALLRQPKIEVIEPESEQVIIGGQEVTAEEVIVQPEGDDRSGSVGMMEEVMQKVDEKIRNQDVTFDKKLAKMRAEMENSAAEKMKNLDASFEKRMMEMGAKGIDQNNTEVVRTDTNHETSETTSSRKKCLLGLKKLISSFDSPETAAIEQKIDTVVQNLPEDDERPFPPGMIGAVIATADRFIAQLL